MDWSRMQAMLQRLRELPRVGWMRGPSPVDGLDGLRRALGLGWLGAKRDDKIPALHGGSKVRKLDLLLAQDPWRDAARWASVGAIGSGHLVALAAAAADRGRFLEAFTFWEPLSDGVIENLAFTASAPVRLHYHANRVALALRSPAALIGRRAAGGVVVPPGGTLPQGIVGTVLAGLELSRQIDQGVLPEPDHIYVPVGSGGTVAGLALGLGLVGRSPLIHAVATVERPFIGLARLRALMRQTLRWLQSRGAAPAVGLQPAPIVMNRAQLGRGYGHPTLAGQAAVARARGAGLQLESVYSGKAMAGLIADAPSLAGQRVLFWVTPHGARLPADDDWRTHLPKALSQRLSGPSRGFDRRQVLVGVGGVAAVLGGAGLRLGGHGVAEGDVLAGWELAVLAAAAEALIPDQAGPLGDGGPSAAQVASNVDRYLRGMPAPLMVGVHALLAAVEHGTFVGAHALRFTRLSASHRRRWLDRLGELPRVGLVSRTVRDLCLLGYYQDPRTWPDLDYDGPLVPAPGDPARGPDLYARLVAPPGQLPPGAALQESRP